MKNNSYEFNSNLKDLCESFFTRNEKNPINSEITKNHFLYFKKRVNFKFKNKTKYKKTAKFKNSPKCKFNLISAKIIFIVFLLFNFQALNASSVKSDIVKNDISLNKNDVNCDNLEQLIDENLSKISKLYKNIEILLNKKGKSEIDLADIFKINLNDPKIINNRKIELSNILNSDKLLETEEFRKYLSCSKSDEFKDKILNLSSLQAQLNLKRMIFLEKDDIQRKELIEIYKSNKKQIKDNILLDDIAKSQKIINDEKSDITSLRNESIKISNREQEKILNAHEMIKKNLIDLELNQIKFIKDFDQKNNKAYFLLKKLSAIKYEDISKDLVSKYLVDVSGIWRYSVDWILGLYYETDISLDLIMPPKLEINNLARENLSQYNNYIIDYNKFIKRRQGIVNYRSEIIDELKIQAFNLLYKSGKVRADILNYCDKIKCDRPKWTDEQNILDIKSEIKVIPLELASGILDKLTTIKSKLYTGIQGWIDLGNQMLLLFLLFFILFIFKKSLKFASTKLDSLRKHILSFSVIRYKYLTKIAIWIVRLNPFLPFLGMILAVEISQILLADIDLVVRLLYYFEIYFFYCIVKLGLEVILESWIKVESFDKVHYQREKIKKSVTFVSRLFFLEYIFLHLIEELMHRSLTYNIFSNIIFIINLLYIIFELKRWKKEIKSAFESRFPYLWGKFSFVENSRFYFAAYFIFLIFIVTKDILSFIFYHLSKLDFTKRALSNIFRKKLEKINKNNANNNQSVPEKYLKEFDYYLAANENNIVELKKSVFRDSVAMIKSWISGEIVDDVAIICGNRGMGKTTILNQIYNKKYEEGIKTIISQIPNRTINKENLYSWFSSFIEYPVKNPKDLIDFDKSLSGKIIICIDDIQNLFISKIGGFEAYRIFIEILNIKTNNIFWCLSINSRSWSYLRGVFGIDYFYGKLLKISEWKDFEIQKLIMSRHEIAGFEHFYDEAIKAYGSGDEIGQQVESQFFRLLWGQSRGNPRSALMYWISAISYSQDDKIHIGIPSFMNSNIITEISDESLFLLASIARHESLTLDEMALITEIDHNIIKKFLKEAVDKGLVWIDLNNSVRITSRAQYMVDNLLIGRNFLYE